MNLRWVQVALQHNDTLLFGSVIMVVVIFGALSVVGYRLMTNREIIWRYYLHPAWLRHLGYKEQKSETVYFGVGLLIPDN